MVPSQSDDVDDPKADSARAGEVRLRIMAANITSGNAQAYEDPGIHIFKGVAPDVVMLQELNYKTNSAADLRAFVDRAFGPGYYYWREAGAQIPNGIVSKYPIVDAGEWDDVQVGNRDFAWARIDVPGATDLYVISVHLLTSGETVRDAEAQALVAHIQAWPSGAYVVLGGDFNTTLRTEPCVVTLGQALVTTGPFPVDGAGNENTNSTRAKPYDWVLANAALDARQVPVTIGANSFASGLVVDTRVYMPLADLTPAVAADSAAVNMQHMAVVRDFTIPTDDGPAASVTVTAPNGGETWAAGSSHAITWAASAVTQVKLEVALDGTTWSTLVASLPASPASFTWTVPATATTAARVRISDVTGQPTDTSDGPFTVTVSAPPTGKVFMNEILANEPGADQAGELVEIVNGTGAAADLSGWTISDSRQVRHVFAPGSSVAAGAAIVVYGHESGIPAGVVAIGSSTGLLGITNSGDTVTLATSGGVTVDSMSFTSSSFPARDGESMNRRPDADPAGSFVLHPSMSTALSSPGTRVDGSPFVGGGPSDPPDGGAITAESEPNDSAATADGPVGSGVAVRGATSSATDVDWYRVTVPVAGRITISVAIDAAKDLDWYLYRAENPTTYVARGYTTSSPETGTYDAAAGTYLIKVVGYQGAQSGYSLTVR